jgi:hypothetical protein
MGRRIAPFSAIPFGQAPIYVTSKKLSVTELRERIRTAQIENVTSVNMYALPLQRPATEKQALFVRIENQLAGKIIGGFMEPWTGGPEKAIEDIKDLKPLKLSEFWIEPGAVAEVALPWPGVPASSDNLYGVELCALFNDGSVTAGPPRELRHRQTIEVAQVVRRTVKVDGKLDDWKGVTPITFFTAGDEKEDPITYLLNPNLKRPESPRPPVSPSPRPRVWFAYDDKFLYVAATGIGTEAEAGKISRAGLPYRKGWPDGLEHPATIGHSLIVSFGFRDRVPGYGRQMDDPWAWKGYFNDTDHQFIAYPTTDGPRLVRQWGPDTNRANGFQIDPLPHIKPVPGAQLAITAECYELAIPRAELQGFDPKQERCRIGILIDNKLNWAQSAGVFDHWQNLGSYAPTWVTQFPCQTFFGIER